MYGAWGSSPREEATAQAGGTDGGAACLLQVPPP